MIDYEKVADDQNRRLIFFGALCLRVCIPETLSIRWANGSIGKE